jgi:hypothetical protein
MRKLILATSLAALTTLGAGVAWTATASAASGVACTKLTANVNKSKGTISGCSDTANTGGKGTFSLTTLASGSGTVTWNKTGTTKVDKGTFTTVSPSACPTGDTEYSATGDVSGGTGKAVKSIKKGWTYQAFVCLNPSTGAITLVKGTDMHFGKAY